MIDTINYKKKKLDTWRQESIYFDSRQRLLEVKNYKMMKK